MVQVNVRIRIYVLCSTEELLIIGGIVSEILFVTVMAEWRAASEPVNRPTMRIDTYGVYIRRSVGLAPVRPVRDIPHPILEPAGR